MKLQSFSKIASINFIIILIAVALSFARYRALGIDDYFGIALIRIWGAFSVGAALALTGAILQAAFQNDLAEPYTLGISSGASFGAVMGTALFGTGSFFVLQLGALVGALFFSMLLILSAIKTRADGSTLLLSGVMLGLFGAGGVSLIYAISDPSGVFGALHWLLGDVSRVDRVGAGVISLMLLSVLLVAVVRSREIELMRYGDEFARSMGVSVHKTRLGFLVLAALLVASTVTWSGVVGFVGLVVPHFARALSLELDRLHFVTVSILGGVALVLADVLGRFAFFPIEVPIGVVTTLLGVPLFIFILYRKAVPR